MYQAQRAARASSAPARCSGPGVSTRITTVPVRRSASVMQQATVNLFADMKRPAGEPAGWVSRRSRASSDAHRADRGHHLAGGGRERAAERGRRSAARRATSGGQVAAVEVSTDGGATWHPATGRGTWSYVWATPTTGAATVRVRAVDDSGNSAEHVRRPCRSRLAALPARARSGRRQSPTGWRRRRSRASVELGTRFRTSAAGSVTALRFYKHSQNTGTHVGSLWSSTRHVARAGDVHGRDGLGMAECRLWHAGGHSRRTPTTSCRITRAPGFYTGDDGYFASSGVSSGPSARAAGRRRAVQRPVQVRRQQRVPRPRPTAARTTGCDVVFNTSGGSSDTTAPVVTHHDADQRPRRPR